MSALGPAFSLLVGTGCGARVGEGGFLEEEPKHMADCGMRRVWEDVRLGCGWFKVGGRGGRLRFLEARWRTLIPFWRYEIQISGGRWGTLKSSDLQCNFVSQLFIKRQRVQYQLTTDPKIPTEFNSCGMCGSLCTVTEVNQHHTCRLRSTTKDSSAVATDWARVMKI